MNLTNKNILFLGSSVTYGSAAQGVSFVDLIREDCNANCLKEAVSGTTLADLNERSYVARLKAFDATSRIDLFVCQLSTNDAKKKIAPQEIRKAICFILEHVEKTFACPIVFYTGTYFESEAYANMVDMLYELQKEYRFAILDLYHDAEMRDVTADDYARYMKDPIHPTLAGYREWWTPKFIEFLNRL